MMFIILERTGSNFEHVVSTPGPQPLVIIQSDADTIVNDELTSPDKEKSNAEKKHDSPITKGKDPLSDEDMEDGH